MWGDLSFDVRSFSPESFGPSWGLTWEAGQELIESRNSGGDDAKGGRKNRSAMRPAAPVYPWYEKVSKTQESGGIRADSQLIAPDPSGYDHGGIATPKEKREDSAAAEAVQLLRGIDDASNGILLTKKALGKLTHAAALKARQRQDEEAAMLALFAMMADDD